jgi:hypothetical protein
MTLDEAREALRRGETAVVYRPCPHCDRGTEEGTITSVNGSYVFVRYGRQRGSAATNAADLTLLAGKSAAGEDQGHG